MLLKAEQTVAEHDKKTIDRKVKKLGPEVQVFRNRIKETFTCNKRKRIMMEFDKIMNRLTRELNSSLKSMSKAKDVNEKEAHSRIVKNLCESLGVFLDLASDMMPLDFDIDSDREDMPF